MTSIDKLLGLTRDKLEYLRKNSEESREHASEWGAKFLELYEKGQNEAGLALALAKEDDAKIHNRISRVSLLMEMTLSIVGMVNHDLKELEKKYPEIRSELDQKIGKKLDPLLKRADELQKIDEDINRKAKDREDKVRDMFG